MNGDEWCALIGCKPDDPALKRLLSSVGAELELDEDGDGCLELIEEHGVQLDLAGGAVLTVQLIREYFRGAPPKGLTWEGGTKQVTLPELRRQPDHVIYDAGAYELKLVLDEGRLVAFCGDAK